MLSATSIRYYPPQSLQAGNMDAYGLALAHSIAIEAYESQLGRPPVRPQWFACTERQFMRLAFLAVGVAGIVAMIVVG